MTIQTEACNPDLLLWPGSLCGSCSHVSRRQACGLSTTRASLRAAHMHGVSLHPPVLIPAIRPLEVSDLAGRAVNEAWMCTGDVGGSGTHGVARRAPAGQARSGKQTTTTANIAVAVAARHCVCVQRGRPWGAAGSLPGAAHLLDWQSRQQRWRWRSHLRATLPQTCSLVSHLAVCHMSELQPSRGGIQLQADDEVKLARRSRFGTGSVLCVNPVNCAAWLPQLGLNLHSVTSEEAA